MWSSANRPDGEIASARPRDVENRRFRIRCANSIPLSVMAAVRADLKPVIQAQRRFDRTMILFNDVIEVLTAPHWNVFPFRILAGQKPQCLMTERIAVERHLSRPLR